MLFFWLSSNVGVLYDRLWVRHRSAARTPGIDGARAAVERRPHTQVGIPDSVAFGWTFFSPPRSLGCVAVCVALVVWCGL